ncbi:hypothetical protein [Actinoplanes auranticolor]|uniref:Uncharacterized protein n=1 Tax=Actinoplanes auranticolor TaxID=47988 RepID=A0A919VZ99_9ACTN|nr:hypothetical protein [Actinoplanes auranticolor]GIM80200.1 hypothetical protein Aau02nite_89430 [Actinoplanes auranticolor]
MADNSFAPRETGARVAIMILGDPAMLRIAALAAGVSALLLAVAAVL